MPELRLRANAFLDVLSAPEPALAGRPRRVLLVEDDPLQARGLLRLLGTMGIACHNVPTVTAALEAVASQPIYDAIVSDLGLQGLSGAELAARLRRPLLIAYTGRDERPRWFDAHVVKPHVVDLLRMLHGRRLTVAITSLAPGDCLGHAKEAGILCRASSPVHALHLLAKLILEVTLEEDGLVETERQIRVLDAQGPAASRSATASGHASCLAPIWRPCDAG